MELLIKWEILALIASPFVLAIMRRRGAITDKQATFTIAILISLLAGTLYLDKATPEPFSPTLKDWSIAIGISLLIWVFLRWLDRLWFK